LIMEMGGENPPLRQVMWLRLIFKDHKPTAKFRRRSAAEKYWHRSKSFLR
jgi:hypothetical protein